MTQLLAAQVRALITERDRLSGRIALLESSIDDMSGTIKKQAAATAAVLVAKENPPAPSTKTQAASPPAANADKDTTASIPPNPLPKADPTPSAVPMPPARIANASAVENDQPAPKQAEFGLDLGGGATGYRLTVCLTARPRPAFARILLQHAPRAARSNSRASRLHSNDCRCSGATAY